MNHDQVIAERLDQDGASIGLFNPQCTVNGTTEWEYSEYTFDASFVSWSASYQLYPLTSTYRIDPRGFLYTEYAVVFAVVFAAY